MFNAKLEKDKIVKFIRDYFHSNNLGGAVIGISGGKDSAVVAALLCEAIGSENVLGVTMPCHSKDEDRDLAKKLASHYSFNLINVDLTNVFDDFRNEVLKIEEFTKEETKNSDINLKPRLRMSTLYYLAALYSSFMNKTFIVAGTSNKSELFVGYFTKGGDSVHDIAPIADLYVSEVIAIGEELNVPKEILYRVPSDGLSAMSDEEKLGVKYSEIESYMEDESSVSKEVANKIDSLHKKSLHKFHIPTYIKKDEK